MNCRVRATISFSTRETALDSASEFLRVLRHEKSLSTAHRALRLRLAHAEELSDDILLPQRITGSEAICGGLEYRVSCIASDAALPLKELIALPAEIQVVTDRGQLRSICGIVTEARSGDADGALATYQLVLRDALSVMEKRVNSRIFRYRIELEIVQVLFDEWRHANAVLGGAFEYELDPLFDMRLYPPREQTMQYNESDAAFVRRLLRRRGISWTVRPGRSRSSSVDPLHDRIPAHTLVLFADASHLPQNAAGSVRYHRGGASEERDTITSWGAARTLQPGSATRHSWDYKNPGAQQFMSTTAHASLDQGGHGNGLAASLDDYLIDTPHAGNDVEDGWRLGQLRMQRHEFEAKCFHGEGSVRDFCAGQYFTLQDHPEIDTHPAAERQFVITELQVSARNNLPGELAARVDRLLAQNGWCALPGAAHDSSVQVRFAAVRRGVPIVPAYDPRVDLPHPQLQSALVVGPQNEELHCDRLGRVKIRFPGMRAQDHEHAHGAGASGSAADSAWVRVAANWAGNGPGSQQQFGALTLPRVGTEVLVAFLGGDPDRPVILSQVFNQNGEPPALSLNGGLPGNRYLSGLKSREIGGQRANQLRFDDTRGEISAQVSSGHAHSELNLGWLSRPRANGQGEPRGEGAELRSDKAVALRGAQGVLISAEASGHDQLERDGLVGLAEVIQGVLEALERQAISHNEDEESKPRLAELVDKLKRWHEGSNIAPGSGGAPILAATGPAGVILASEDNVAIGAQSKIDLVSVADTELSAGRNLFVRAARSLSMFAYSLGMKLVAGRGNIMLQTHEGHIEIKSSGRISLIAAEGIDLQAPEVRVVAQGAQTVWGNDAITQQSAGEHIVKAAAVAHLGPAGATPRGVDLAGSHLETDERAVVYDRQTGLPAKGRRYVARHQDGTTITGITDEEGRTDVLQTYSLGDIELRLMPEDEQDTGIRGAA